MDRFQHAQVVIDETMRKISLNKRIFCGKELVLAGGVNRREAFELIELWPMASSW